MKAVTSSTTIISPFAELILALGLIAAAFLAAAMADSFLAINIGPLIFI